MPRLVLGPLGQAAACGTKIAAGTTDPARMEALVRDKRAALPQHRSCMQLTINGGDGPAIDIHRRHGPYRLQEGSLLHGPPPGPGTAQHLWAGKAGQFETSIGGCQSVSHAKPASSALAHWRVRSESCVLLQGGSQLHCTRSLMPTCMYN
ncbi:hypothetical protein HaLaN_03028 [Haematococcus lacustris]|uniref:Uncharacterized protein n=1 Tax=Haematococcus lacustris TaxID=44745 RepID=A0A699YFR0_HAELA|nr:hypothetical protein HaLaN_03028 [Haematococcus lacustris]